MTSKASLLPVILLIGSLAGCAANTRPSSKLEKMVDVRMRELALFKGEHDDIKVAIAGREQTWPALAAYLADTDRRMVALEGEMAELKGESK